MKKIIKPIFMIIIILFFMVFINRNNYYENRTVLSEKSIKQFELDLKEGKEINPSNYLTKEKNYNNNYLFQIYTSNISVQDALQLSSSEASA